MSTEADPPGPPAHDDAKLSNVEKHERMRAALLKLIESMDDGEALPPERTLAEDLNAARMTVRKVVDILIGQGYLRRVAGKGTFVARSRLVRANSREPFTNYTHYGATAAEATVLELVTEDAGSRIGQRLQLAPSAKIIRISRVTTVGGEPVSIERIHLPAHLFPTVAAADFSTLMLDEFYKTDFGIRVSKTSQVLRVTSINQAESQILAVPLHAPAFFAATIKTDIDDRVVEYTEAVYRGDKYRFLHETTSGEGYSDSVPPDGRSLFNAHFIIN